MKKLPEVAVIGPDRWMICRLQLHGFDADHSKHWPGPMQCGVRDAEFLWTRIAATNIRRAATSIMFWGSSAMTRLRFAKRFLVSDFKFFALATSEELFCRFRR